MERATGISIRPRRRSPPFAPMTGAVRSTCSISSGYALARPIRTAAKRPAPKPMQPMGAKVCRCFRGSAGRSSGAAGSSLCLSAPTDERWDLCFIAEYPSVAAFVAMIRDPVYREAVKHRQAAVEDFEAHPPRAWRGRNRIWLSGATTRKCAVPTRRSRACAPAPPRARRARGSPGILPEALPEIAEGPALGANRPRKDGRHVYAIFVVVPENKSRRLSICLPPRTIPSRRVTRSTAEPVDDADFGGFAC